MYLKMNKIEKGMPKKKYPNLRKKTMLTIKKQYWNENIAPKDKEHWILFFNVKRKKAMPKEKEECWKKKNNVKKIFNLHKNLRKKK